jgi:DNA-binding GntR family transcriptional regulator
MTTTLAEEAYRFLKEKLVHTPKGSYLSIRKVAEEMNMSYTPVREAFLKLHKEGFLELVPKVGFFVTSIELDEIIQIYEARECIELFVFQRIFNEINKEHIELLKGYLEEQKRHLEKKEIYDFVKTDQKFHEVFLNIYKNRYLNQVYRNIREQYLVCSKNIAEGQSNVAIKEHEELIKWIERRNPEKALEVLQTHIQNAKKRVSDGYSRVRASTD